jgi:glycosyltransferase involved in cell wall biosynthesis
MNILIFIHSLHSGGAERVAVNLSNYWAEKSWQVTVVTLTSPAADFYKLHPSVRRIALDVADESGNPLAAVLNNLRRIFALRRVLRQLQPDVALAMMNTANILLALAATGLRALITVGSEHIHPPQISLARPWDVLRVRLYGHLTALTALTVESAAWLRQHTRARNIPVIPNAVSWPLPQQPPHLPPPPRKSGRRILLAVGRLSEQKGFDILIQVFQRLARDFPDWRLVILGEGPDRKALEAQIASAGLADRISLPGRAGNVGQWYETADLYVLSSRFEGFPNTLTEAMAHGLPVVSFDCDTGPRAIIRHEVDGLLAPAGDGATLETALRRLMLDEALRSRFAARALEARERFSLQRIGGLWDKLFEEIQLKSSSSENGARKI